MKLMLLDTYGLVYRAFFALPALTTTKGVPINAAYGFTMMLNKLMADEKPTHVIAAFDKGMPAARLAMYKEYKAQRDAMPDELRGQFALVRQILATFDIPIVEMEGQEADDVIATLARQVEDAGEHTIVVTGDLDLLQLVDEFTTVLTTRRGITDLGRYDVAAVRERFGLEPSQLPDYRGLKGDPSDNLPGIPGVGEKTAMKLLQAAGSLDALVADPALAGTAKLQALIEQYGAQAQLCRTVSIVRRDLPLPLDRETSRFRAPADADLYKLYGELEFKTLLAKLQPPVDLPLFETEKKLEGHYRSFAAAVDPPEFVRLAADIRELAGRDRFAVAVLGDSIGFSAADGEGFSMPLDALSARRGEQSARRNAGERAARRDLRCQARRASAARPRRDAGRHSRRCDDCGAPARSVAYLLKYLRRRRGVSAIGASRRRGRARRRNAADARVDAAATRGARSVAFVRRRRSSAGADAGVDGSGRRRDRSRRTRRHRCRDRRHRGAPRAADLRLRRRDVQPGIAAAAGQRALRQAPDPGRQEEQDRMGDRRRSAAGLGARVSRSARWSSNGAR